MLYSIEEIKNINHKYFCVIFPGEAPVNTYFCGNTCANYDCSGRIASSRTSVVQGAGQSLVVMGMGGTPL